MDCTKRFYPFFFLFIWAWLLGPHAGAQSLVSGFMVGKGHGSVALSGTAERYKEVYLVPENVDEVPIFKKVQVTSVSLYGTYGLTDRIEAVVSLPYIRAEGNADQRVLDDLGYTNTRSGLQDITALLKFKSLSLELGTNILDLLGVVGVSTPLGNYETEPGLEYIIAIGNRATKLTTLGVAHLKTRTGIFFTGQAGYSLRNNRVPNAFVADTKIGYAGRKIYAEGWASFQESSDEGTDILQPGFDEFFPATRVNYVRVGASAYRPIVKGFGLVLGVNAYVAGRNLGKSTGVSAGVSRNF